MGTAVNVKGISALKTMLPAKTAGRASRLQLTSSAIVDKVCYLPTSLGWQKYHYTLWGKYLCSKPLTEYDLGFTGRNCETNINDCGPRISEGCPEVNAVDGIGNCYCRCPHGRTGINCEKGT